MIGNYLWPERLSAGEHFVCTCCLESVFCYPRCMPPKYCRLCFYRHQRYDDSEYSAGVWNLPEDFETQEAFEEHKAKVIERAGDDCHVFVNRFEEDSIDHIEIFLKDGHYPKSFMENDHG